MAYVVLVCSRCLQFIQFSVPLSLSNMNNVHNTFFVATLIYNVVQHFLSQLKKTMLSLPLAFDTSNALAFDRHFKCVGIFESTLKVTALSTQTPKHVLYYPPCLLFPGFHVTFAHARFDLLCHVRLLDQ